MPVISPASETWKNCASKRAPAQRTSSNLRSIWRLMLNPQTVPSGGKFRLLKGIANSALQPRSDRCVATFQMASQSSFVSPFANTRPSTRAPFGFVEK